MWLKDTPAGTTTDTTDFWSQLPALIGQGLQIWNQQQVMDYALQQAKAGTPLPQSVLSTMLNQASPSVNVGLSSGTQSVLEYALIGGAVIAGLFLLTKTARR